MLGSSQSSSFDVAIMLGARSADSPGSADSDPSRLYLQRPDVRATAYERFRRARLTPRQFVCMDLWCAGKTHAAIALELDCTRRAVSFCVARAQKALDQLEDAGYHGKRDLWRDACRATVYHAPPSTGAYVARRTLQLLREQDRRIERWIDEIAARNAP